MLQFKCCQEVWMCYNQITKLIVYMKDAVVSFVVTSCYPFKRAYKIVVLLFFIIKICKSWQLKCKGVWRIGSNEL